MKQTSLVYLRCGEDYLMLHRVGSKKQQGFDENAGKWIGFGGKLEAGETPQACAFREVLEETGLTLTSYAYRGIVDFASDVYGEERMHLFTADGFEGELRACDEGEIARIGIKDYLSLPMWEGDRIFLSLIEDPKTPFFRLSLTYRGEELTEAVLDGRVLRKNEGAWT